MKKIFSFIFGAVFVFSAFSETGYQGLQWYDTEKKCVKTGYLEPYFENGSVEDILLKDTLQKSMTIKKNKTVILGKKNNVAYVFTWAGNNDYWLAGISYIISPLQAKEIINRFSIVRKYKTSKKLIYGFDFEDDTLTALGFSPDLYDIPLEVDNLSLQIQCFNNADSYEERGEDAFYSEMKLEIANEQNENYPGTLYIFDYNEDTRMYVFDNLVKDKAVVVYVPHEQDY